MVSFVGQFISTRQRGDLELQAGVVAAQWIRFIFVAAAAALSTKASVLWSESRMLRKIRARHPRQLRDSLISEHPDHAFAELYVSLSKGRHRTYSRFYPFLYYVFTFLLDTMVVLEFLVGGDSFNSDVSSSEELTTFRILIHLGSFATFGAVNLNIAQSSLLVLCSLTLAALHIVSGYGILRLSMGVRYGLIVAQMTLILGFLCVWLKNRFADHQTSLPGLVSRMASVREQNFHDPDLERINLRQSLSERQSRRLDNMEELAIECKVFDVKKARELEGWWSEDFADFVVFFLVSGLSAMAWGHLSADDVPKLVFLECLEATGTFLLYINNTVVEKMLFVKLLQIARIPKSGTQGIGNLIEHGSYGTPWD